MPLKKGFNKIGKKLVQLEKAEQFQSPAMKQIMAHVKKDLQMHKDVLLLRPADEDSLQQRDAILKIIRNMKPISDVANVLRSPLAQEATLLLESGCNCLRLQLQDHLDTKATLAGEQVSQNLDILRMLAHALDLPALVDAYSSASNLVARFFQLHREKAAVDLRAGNFLGARAQLDMLEGYTQVTQPGCDHFSGQEPSFRKAYNGIISLINSITNTSKTVLASFVSCGRVDNTISFETIQQHVKTLKGVNDCLDEFLERKLKNAYAHAIELVRKRIASTSKLATDKITIVKEKGISTSSIDVQLLAALDELKGILVLSPAHIQDLQHVYKSMASKLEDELDTQVERFENAVMSIADMNDPRSINAQLKIFELILGGARFVSEQLSNHLEDSKVCVRVCKALDRVLAGLETRINKSLLDENFEDVAIQLQKIQRICVLRADRTCDTRRDETVRDIDSRVKQKIKQTREWCHQSPGGVGADHTSIARAVEVIESAAKTLGERLVDDTPVMPCATAYRSELDSINSSLQKLMMDLLHEADKSVDDGDLKGLRAKLQQMEFVFKAKYPENCLMQEMPFIQFFTKFFTALFERCRDSTRSTQRLVEQRISEFESEEAFKELELKVHRIRQISNDLEEYRIMLEDIAADVTEIGDLANSILDWQDLESKLITTGHSSASTETHKRGHETGDDATSKPAKRAKSGGKAPAKSANGTMAVENGRQGGLEAHTGGDHTKRLAKRHKSGVTIKKEPVGDILAAASAMDVAHARTRSELSLPSGKFALFNISRVRWKIVCMQFHEFNFAITRQALPRRSKCSVVRLM